jgi:CheY-like chemotaxis protein
VKEGTVRVLVVEDDPSIQQLIVEVLAEEGIESAAASDGQTAIQLAREAHPDLILMDLMLPVLDGVSAIQQLKADPDTRAIRVIAMSAGTNLRLHAEHLPADGVLAKPFDLDTLLATVTIEGQRTGEPPLAF